MADENRSSDELDAAMRGLLEHCDEHGVYFSPKLAPYRIPGRRLGIYSVSRILKGERLIQVPATALLTTKSIPTSFASAPARKHVAVHAMLAAYLAFGLPEGSNPHERWTATWPKLADFTHSMPMLWPEQDFNALGEAPAAKRRKTAHKLVDSTVSLLPPPTSGSWTSPTTAVTYPSGSTPGAAAQRLKLHRHLEQVATYIPRLAEGLLSPTSPKYWRFVHMWCCVNSRCFYYLHPRQSKPSDPNEAIAIAPGMDLFNHTDNPGCSTKYDKNGYTVIADRSYDAGEEVQLNYGPHANDVLWSEYGFLMDENADDAVQIETIVLRSITEKQRRLMEDHGYLGDYWLKTGGVCWRTEVASWSMVLKEKEFKMLLAGIRVPAESDKRTRIHHSNITKWLVEVETECERNIQGVNDMSVEKIIALLGDREGVLIAQGYEQSQIVDVRKKQALTRYAMCVKRWEQILQMSASALEVWRE